MSSRFHSPTGHPAEPETLFTISGASRKPAASSETVLVVIDAQEEYRTGRLPLDGIGAAVAEAACLLHAARTAGMPVIHVVHHAAAGSPLFDPTGRAAAIMHELMPTEGEAVVVKRLPNAFTDTALDQHLSDIAAATGRRALLIAGFMTHNCVSATARAALDRGIVATVVAAATATRDLPGPFGGTIPAAVIQTAELAALADRTAVVVPDTDAVMSVGGLGPNGACEAAEEAGSSRQRAS